MYTTEGTGVIYAGDVSFFLDIGRNVLIWLYTRCATLPKLLNKDKWGTGPFRRQLYRFSGSEHETENVQPNGIH